MSIDTMMRTPVTIHKPAETEGRYGATTASFDTADGATSHETTGWLHQINSAEADVTVTVGVLFLRADEDIDQGDRVTVGGALWLVAGAPNRARKPDGTIHHLEVSVKGIS